MKNKKQLDWLGPKPRQAFLKVQVNFPAAKVAISAFAKNRMKALEIFTNDLRESVSEAVNQLLKSEMTLFLGQPEQTDNKRNGYRIKDYYLKGVGCLRIELPRDRKGEFESKIIPSRERIDPRTRQDLALLHLAGLSNRTLSMISKHLLRVAVSKDTVSSSIGLISKEAKKWLTRPIINKYWALYIDGTNFKVQRRGSTEREPSLVVLGVSDRNYRSILSIEPGTRDNVECWRSVFRDLKQRGLDASTVRIGIMDGLPGLEKLFREEFPNAVTARCWRHAMQNAIAKTPARLRDSFKELSKKVMYAASEDAARKAFSYLKEVLNKDAQRAVYCLEKDLDSLLVHYRFEECYWRGLKTTNAVERINKEFKRRTKSMETLGESTLMAVVAFTALRLEMGWQRNPIDSRALDNLRLPDSKKLLDKNPIEKTIETLHGESVH